jgi:hypothetical protein
MSVQPIIVQFAPTPSGAPRRRVRSDGKSSASRTAEEVKKSVREELDEDRDPNTKIKAPGLY